MDLFRVRLNCIDHYQTAPTRYDPQLRNDIRPSQASKGPKVPVIRVFGSTETGQKVCAHIHGAFPYLFVEYPGSLVPEEGELDGCTFTSTLWLTRLTVGAFIYRLHLSIDHALSVSYRKDQYGQNVKYVARITLVKGVPFYGFHVGYRYFLKIYMFNPIVMTRLADLLQQGVIMKRRFQPYEAHLQFLLQFMTDYNLYGCDYLESSKARFRSPVPERDDASSSPHLWHSQSILPDQITDDLALPRVSHCSVEVDICVQDIVNRRSVKARNLHHDFIERTNPLPGDIKLVHSMAGLWADETKRRKRQMPASKQGSTPFPPEVLVTMSADPRQSQPMGWLHEEEYRDLIRELIKEEEKNVDAEGLSFENFTKPPSFEDTVNTALESVEDLYPSTLMPVLGLPANPPDGQVDPANGIEVDDLNVPKSQAGEEDFFPDDSDEELLRELGNADMAKPSAASGNDPPASPDESLLRRSVAGVCLSGMQTGKLPSILISQEFLSVAEHEGAIGRTFKSRAPIMPNLKRTGSELDLVPAKRIRTEDVFAIAAQNQPGQIPISEQHHPVTTTSDVSTPKGKILSVTGLLGSNSNVHPSVVSNSAEHRTKSYTPKQTQSTPSGSQQIVQADQVPDSYASIPGVYLTSSFLASSPLSTTEPEPIPDINRIQTAMDDYLPNSNTFIYSVMPPDAETATSSLQDNGLSGVLYQDAFYSRDKDVPVRTREYAGREFRLEGNTLPWLPDFDPTGLSLSLPNPGAKKDIDAEKAAMRQENQKRRRNCNWKGWEISRPPPTYREVSGWWDKVQERSAARQRNGSGKAFHSKRYLSQIDGPTPKNKHGFAYTQKDKSTSVQHEVQYMSTMSVEVHVNTRGKFVPNPEQDEVQCIFWSVKSDETALNSQNPDDAIQSGVLALCVEDIALDRIRRQAKGQVIAESSELDLMIRLVEIVRSNDPDVLTGYEVHGGSWGYLIERARVKYDFNLCDEFSRMKTESHGRFGKENDRWGFNTTSTIRVTGRHMINIWRAMRGELNLLQYTMENVVWHLLHRRIPHYAWKTLTAWYSSGKIGDLGRLLQYYQIRTRLDLEILEANELIPRTSEQARLLGVDFFSVFSRGSQFKVESIMFRIAKPENLMLVSPNRKQVGGQNALECLPLVMEPQSAFYNSPLLVLDFQSLYPSVMIAYNYCYSTFLGRITNWRGMNKMGFTEYKRQQGLLALLQDYINIAPNGMMYVKTEIRKSLLAKMLTEILETRVMVKSGMKKDKDDKTLQQLLNNRQLALKLLANVTYGYTSASFSGRMPCSEIADSIVQTGRETLERAIAYIHSVERWGAEVVYGDTDSLFVYLKGRTRDQAFDIGNEIAKAITDMNPRPIKLKFEKVYHPCVLLAKKRYVGYKYESKDQAQPEFDAKGIETVRRDGTPAEQKIEEKVLKMLFETADLSQIKRYFQTQCEKIMRGNVSIQDFSFAREVRLGTYSDKGPPPAGALISTRKMLEDARAEPQYGERVPYVVITGAPGARLIDRCVAPEDLLENPHWRLDAQYYISKNLIPPLERIFNLVGANVRQWYDEMPKIQRIHHVFPTGGPNGGKKFTLESYMRSTHCVVCTRRFKHVGNHQLCPRCRKNVPASLAKLQTRLQTEERKYEEDLSICRSCSGLMPLEEVKCDSKDCPVFWRRMRQLGKVRRERGLVVPVINGLLEGVDRQALEW